MRAWSFWFSDLSELAGERSSLTILEDGLLVTVREDALIGLQLMRLDHLAVSSVVCIVFGVMKLLVECLDHLLVVG